MCCYGISGGDPLAFVGIGGEVGSLLGDLRVVL
jgi:hypothetical protein